MWLLKYMRSEQRSQNKTLGNQPFSGVKNRPLAHPVVQRMKNNREERKGRTEAE